MKTQKESVQKMVQPHSSGGNRGFTAVETIIGASIMITLIAGMLQIISQSNYLVELARDNTRITQMLQSEMEDLRTLNWSDLVEKEGFSSFTPQGNFISQYADDYYCYRYIYPSPLSPDEKWVWVYAYWVDSMNRGHWTWFFTTFTKDGLNDYYYRSV